MAKRKRTKVAHRISGIRTHNDIGDMYRLHIEVRLRTIMCIVKF
jgi:hypothetical protein